MTSVLLTGASGFIGRRVLGAGDESEYRIIAAGRRPVGDRYIILDLNGPLDSLPRADWVFHLAGGYAGADARTLDCCDLDMARRLIDWGKRQEIKNWVFASAAEVYGRSEGSVTEDSPTQPLIPYGRVKLQIERMFTQLADEAPDSRVALLRIGEAYGPDGTLIDELTARFRTSFCPWFGSGDVPVSFVHVDDVARSFWAAARAAPLGVSIWNIADDEPVTWREFLDYLADLLGARKAIGLPLPLARLYAAASTAADRVRRRTPTVTQHVVTLLTTPKPLSNRRARDELGWELRYPEYRGGLRATVSS
ncbi:MAG: NAD(P)-dependent oxidoreductase [Gemmatimonadota bacterium]|nr:MAG: NAD(P)-dependent oxidoreductase [Gemmatimonadota bacterium]